MVVKFRLPLVLLVLMLLAGFLPGVAFYLEHRMRLRLYPERAARRSEQPLARTPGDRLRAPGWLLRGTVLDAGVRSRARSPRARPRSNSTSTRRRIATSSSATTRRSIARRTITARSADLTLAQLREMDNAYWWIAGETVTPGRRRLAVPRAGQGAGESRLRHRHARRGRRTIPRRAVEPGPEAHRSRRRALRGVARGRTAPTGPFDVGHRRLVPRHSRCSGSAPSPPRSRRRPRRGRPRRSTSRCSRACRACRRSAPSRCPRSTATSPVVDERFVETAHDADIAVHVWTINDPGEMRELLDVGRRRADQRPTDAHWSRFCRNGTARGTAGRCRRDGLAATAVRLLTVVGLLLGAHLALHGSL